LAVDEDRLLLALERLESVQAEAGAERDVAGLSAGLRVAVGHLTHAHVLAPQSGVVALAAGRVADVVAGPERVAWLAAHVRDGDRWAADELAAVAEASARTDDRRSWHATERAARMLLDDAPAPTRGSLTWILAAAAHRRGDAVGAAAMLTALPGGDPARLSQIAAIAVAAHDTDLGRRVQAAAERLMQRNAGVLFLFALRRHVTAVLSDDVEAQRRGAFLLAETRRPLLYGAAAERAGMLSEALGVYEQCGASADAGRVRQTMAASGVTPIARVRNWKDLSAAELRVVRLVAAGATNPQAAQELCLSPHTVSSHMRNAFDKLGIRSRVELARLYAQRETGLPSPVVTAD
jgi:DNA-binding CsgD family transcriptional regulator